MATLEECPGCRVAPDNPHQDMCDHARCPDCGEQLIQCYDHDDDPVRPAMWHGVDQRAEVARQMNWWAPVTGVDFLMEDSTRVLFADALGQITWDPATQRYVIGQIDEAELDRALRNG